MIKNHIVRHINKKKKCGEKPTLIEIPNELKCVGCNRNYSSFLSLKRHAKQCDEFIDYAIKELLSEC